MWPPLAIISRPRAAGQPVNPAATAQPKPGWGTARAAGLAGTDPVFRLDGGAAVVALSRQLAIDGGWTAA